MIRVDAGSDSLMTVFQRHVNVLTASVGGESGHALLLAVVDLRVVISGDGHRRLFRFPLCCQHVRLRVFRIQPDHLARLGDGGPAVLVGVLPAGEAVALLSETDGVCRYIQHGVASIVFQCKGLVAAFCSVSRLVDHRGFDFGLAPLGGQSRVARDGDLVARLVDLAVHGGLPAQETRCIVRPFQIRTLGLDPRLGILGVRPGIRRNRAASVARIIGHGKGAGVQNIRIQVVVLVDFRGVVERGVHVVAVRAGTECPSHPALAICQSRLCSIEIFFRNLAASGNLDRFIRRAVSRHRVSRRRPLGVQRDALSRHGSASEDVFVSLPQLVVVPAVEMPVFLAGRSLWRIGRICDALLILFGNDFILRAAVDEDDVVAVAAVVEFGVVVAVMIFCTVRVGEPGDRILVFVGHVIVGARTGILMVQGVGYVSVGSSPRFARQRFYIIESGFRTFAGFRAVEGRSIERHYVDIDLIRTTIAPVIPVAFGHRPRTAAIIGRPLVADVSSVFC